MTLALIPNRQTDHGKVFPPNLLPAIVFRATVSTPCQQARVFSSVTINTGIRKIAIRTDVLREGLKRGGYRLSVTGSMVLLEASRRRRVSRLQTLLQIAGQSPPVSSLTSCRDWPDFQTRGYSVCPAVYQQSSQPRSRSPASHFKIIVSALHRLPSIPRGPDMARARRRWTAEDV